MSRLDKHSEQIAETAQKWLNPGSESLQQAVEQTVSGQLFSRADVEFQLSVLRENFQNNEVQEWLHRSGLSENHHATGQKALCLHAGNLPLVGFQTALAVLLSGANYYGKLSRKDPYLLASFLAEVKKSGLDQDIRFSTDLTDFRRLKSDKVLFAGSPDSVPPIKKAVSELEAAKVNAEFIIRTAKFSMVYVDEWNAEIRKQLAEAMLRFGGNGCRSAAVIVSSFELKKVKDELKEAIQAFWEENPQHRQPGSGLRYQFAYNEAVGRNQLWLEQFLIQTGEELPEIDFSAQWVKGGEQKVRELKAKFGQKVQSVYTCRTEIDGISTEPLSTAQRPPLYWKPDGMDVLRKLCDH